MSKHAKPETPLERADRLIWELRIIDRPWNHPRHCKGNETYHNLKSIALEWHSFPQRFLVGIPNPEGLSFARGGRIYMKALAA